MESHKADREGIGPRTHRRAWLTGALAACFGNACFGGEEEEGADVEQYARKQGLKALRSMRSRHYLAIGNAPESYLKITLADCETVSLDTMDHFRKKGFDVAFPQKRLITVVLADEREFSKFLGKPVALNVLGIYMAKHNWLVLQDFRNVPMRSSRAGATNLRTLAHEATHQLTFNIGLLNRRGDTPGCVIEGLGTYGEVRRPNVRMAPGQVNHLQLDNLAHKQRGLGWTPVATLLTDDVLHRSADEHEVALYYAQSWLLVHYMMSDPQRLPQFRSYLAAIRKRTSPELRLDDARAHWGNLDQLDLELKRYSVRLLTAR